MKSRFVIAITCLMLSVVSFVHAQSGLETSLVAGNVHMITGGGGNVGVSVGKDGILIVDDKVMQVAESVVAELKKFDPGELRFILNTHFHGDHTGNNVLLGHDATIIAHHNVRTRLSSQQGEEPPLDPAGWPVITFSEGVTIHFNGEEIEVFHVESGHTDGDAMVYFKTSKVLHMGDQLFSGFYPYVDLDHGGSLDGYLRNTKMVIDRFSDDTVVIPGHGPLSSLQEVRDAYAMIIATRDIVFNRIDDGMSLDDLKAAGLPDEFESWNWSFITTERWVETLHASHD